MGNQGRAARSLPEGGDRDGRPRGLTESNSGNFHHTGHKNERTTQDPVRRRGGGKDVAQDNDQT